jgi:hypothetical protein
VLPSKECGHGRTAQKRRTRIADLIVLICIIKTCSNVRPGMLAAAADLSPPPRRFRAIATIPWMNQGGSFGECRLLFARVIANGNMLPNMCLNIFRKSGTVVVTASENLVRAGKDGADDDSAGRSRSP